MASINIKNIDRKFNMELCKVNKEVVGTILVDYLETIERSINGIDTLELKIPKTIIDSNTFKKIRNPIYNESRDERLILLNGNEYFVIKEDKSSKTSNSKTIKAHSLEYRLGKIDIDIEDVGIYLMIEDKESNIINLHDYMYNETGWKFGYIDDSVRYNIDKDGKKIDKMRYMQSISKRWYEFLTKDIVECFGCIVVFDTFNKLVNLYDINTQGEEVQIHLSYDNYLKDLNTENSSNDIVTRLTLVGNEEMDIISATPSGYKYVENYSYYIDNEEMSKELIFALNKYEEMVAIRTVEWNRLASLKQEKMDLSLRKKTDLFTIYGEIKGYTGQINAYQSVIDAKKDQIIVANAEKDKAIAIAEKTKLDDKAVILKEEIKILDRDVALLQQSILEINKLCKREGATDENGKLIFNVKLLDELKDYVSCDTYTNDSFLDVKDLIKAGKRDLSFKCKPISTYSLDVVNFTKRIIDNGFRKHWNGELSLGNIISLIDEDKEEEILQYFVGYTLKPNEPNGLTIDISDKKNKEDYTRAISDSLAYARRSVKDIARKKYLLNKTKYNRLNL